jgi:hypothetical protein
VGAESERARTRPSFLLSWLKREFTPLLINIFGVFRNEEFDSLIMLPIQGWSETILKGLERNDHNIRADDSLFWENRSFSSQCKWSAWRMLNRIYSFFRFAHKSGVCSSNCHISGHFQSEKFIFIVKCEEMKSQRQRQFWFHQRFTKICDLHPSLRDLRFKMMISNWIIVFAFLILFVLVFAMDIQRQNESHFCQSAKS